MPAIDERHMPIIRRLTASVVVLSALSLPLSAQEPDTRSLEQISLELAKRPPSLGMPIFEPLPGAVKFGPFTLETPQLRGEMIRVSLPVGEYASRVARGLSVANRRRQEAAARRRIEAELKTFIERQRSTPRRQP